MTYDDRPPDAWDDGPGPPLRHPIPKKSEGQPGNRPVLPPAAEALRGAWIAAVRDLHQRRSGHPSRYNSDPQWDGGTKASPTKTGYKTFKPVWPGLVAKALAGGVRDPADLVRALFARWYADTTPTPTALGTIENIEAAASFRQARLNRIVLARTAEEGVFRMAAWAAGLSIPDPRAATAYALNDVGRELSPLFRYSVAVLKDLPDVAARWRPAAEAQFFQDPGPYLEYWSSILPPDLQQAAQPAGTTT